VIACRARKGSTRCGVSRREAPLRILAPAHLSISPGARAFGSQPTGASSPAQTFTLTNDGEVPSGAVSTAITGSDSSSFSRSNDHCAGVVLAPGDECTVELVFSASSTGPKTGTLEASAAGGGSASAELSGTGLAPAELSISPATRDFGTRTNGSTSTAETFTVTNTGEAPSGTISISLGGANPGQFTTSNDGCAGSHLDPGASCTVDAAFAPTAGGGQSASLDASSTPGGTASAALTGTGQTPADLDLTPSSYDFGNVLQGSTSNGKQFTLSNSGQQSASISTIGFSGPDAARYQVVTNTCGSTLAGGASCQIVGTFKPGASDTGTLSAQLDVVASVGDSQSSTVSGTAVTTPAQLEATPSTVATSGDSIPEGTQRSLLLTLTNDGAADTGRLTYTVQINSGNVAATTITFNPDIPGTPNCGGQGAVLKGGESCAMRWGIRGLAGGANAWSATITISGTPGGSTSQTYVNNP
jgi:hypothetical protein